MGVMKQLHLEEMDAQSDDQPTVYVLTCNGRPCNAYLDKATADYDMWLCKQAEAHKNYMENKVVYEITEVILCVH
jgi:hypothetical protein